MKTILFLSGLIFVAGCAEGSSDVGDTSETPMQTASDSGTKDAVTVIHNSGDAGVDARLPSYTACVTSKSVATIYPRLVERSCTDSNGVTYVNDYYDSELTMGCRWRTLNDGKIYCSPENEQSSVEYADDRCTIPIALMSVKAEHPYIGIDTHVDGGGQFVTYYNAGEKYTGTRMWFFVPGEQEGWQCMEESPLNFFGINTYYLGDPLAPVMFVEK